MAISVGLSNLAKSMEGIEVGAIRAVAEAMEVIPRTLIQNCGNASSIKLLTQLRANHANGQRTYGIDGEKGVVVDMDEYGLWESAAVKMQTLKTAIESASLLLRVDDVVSARRRRGEAGGGGGPQVQNMEDGGEGGMMPEM